MEITVSIAGIYFFLALLGAYCTVTAIIQARRLYWLTPVYFFSAWLCGELALIHVLWQVALTAVLAFTGVLSDPLAQSGLGIFALTWIGLVYLHCQAMDTPQHLRPALGGHWARIIARIFPAIDSMCCAMTYRLPTG